jgi:hypothetical protein
LTVSDAPGRWAVSPSGTMWHTRGRVFAGEAKADGLGRLAGRFEVDVVVAASVFLR